MKILLNFSTLDYDIFRTNIAKQNGWTNSNEPFPHRLYLGRLPIIMNSVQYLFLGNTIRFIRLSGFSRPVTITHPRGDRGKYSFTYFLSICWKIQLKKIVLGQDTDQFDFSTKTNIPSIMNTFIKIITTVRYFYK